MLNKYLQYIRYLIGHNRKTRKKNGIVFIVSFSVIIVLFPTIAIFSPEDRLYAFGMLFLAFAICGLVHITGFCYYIKCINLLAGMGEHPIYMQITTYYGDKIVKSGWLCLTKTEFIFIGLEKRPIPVRMQIDDVKAIRYGLILGRAKGIIIARNDDVETAFAGNMKEFESIEQVLRL